MIQESKNVPTQIVRMLESFMYKSNGTAQDALTKLEKESTMINDFLVPSNQMNFVNHIDEVLTPLLHLEGSEINSSYGTGSVPIHPNFLRQFSTRYNIPTAYLSKLSGMNQKWANILIAHTMQDFVSNINREETLIRVNQDARALLSNRYKRFDSLSLYRVFITALSDLDGVLGKIVMEDLKVYMEGIIPRIYHANIEGKGPDYFVPGIRLRNSDYGVARLVLDFFVYIIVCKNGMAGERLLKRTHLGVEIPKNIEASKRTIELNTKAAASVMKDACQTALEGDRLEKFISLVEGAGKKEIEPKEFIRKLPNITTLSKGEIESVESKIMANNPEDNVTGPNSLWKMAQAMTAVGRDLGGAREMEIQEEVGKLITRNKFED